MVDSSQTVGHEQRGTRPHLVLSIGRMNRSRVGLVITLPLTTAGASSPLHVRIEPQPGTGLDRISYAMPEMVRSVSAERFGRLLGRVPADTVEAAAKHTGVLLGLGRTKF